MPCYFQETLDWTEYIYNIINSLPPEACEKFYNKLNQHLQEMVIHSGKGIIAREFEEEVHHLYLSLVHLEAIESVLQTVAAEDYLKDQDHVFVEIRYMKRFLFEKISVIDRMGIF